MGEDDVIPVATSGSLWLIPSDIAKVHSEDVDGYCVACAGVVWPCSIWVEGREVYDAGEEG